MHAYQARITWSRQGATFTDQRYSRVHEWSFDGGLVVKASASPTSVRPPWADPAAVDPEEALVASASSCHMLWFLSLAARRGFVVESYADDASGVMERGADGKMRFTRITLRPRIEFAGETRPSADELRSLHDQAHEDCYIASSLRAEIVVEAV